MRPLSLFAASLLLTGCVSVNFDHQGSDRYQEDFHYSYELQPNGHLIAETFNGKVEIVGWDQNKVDISGTKFGSSERLRDAIRIETQNTPTLVEVRAVHPSSSNGNSGARFVIKVPKQAVIERVTSSNGSLQVEHVASTGTLKTSNGAIRVSDTSGNVNARTSNGAIEVERLSGSLNARSSNGRIRAESISGECEAETSNASINIRLEAPTTAPLRAATSNGSIELDLRKAPGSDIRAQSSNGSITLKMPASAGARLIADTSNSSVSSEFDLANSTSRDRGRKDHLEGTIGAGGPTVDLSTRNGHIRILKTGSGEN